MKLSVILILLAFGALAFGWVTGQDVVLYASIALSAVAGVALLKSTLSSRGSKGRSPAGASSRRRERGRGRRRKKAGQQSSEEGPIFEPPSAVRTVSNPVAIGRSQWPEQTSGTLLEGPGGSAVDFRTRLAAALDTSAEAEDDARAGGGGDLWSDLEGEDQPADGGHPRPNPFQAFDDFSDLEAGDGDEEDEHTVDVEVLDFDREQSAPPAGPDTLNPQAYGVDGELVEDDPQEPVTAEASDQSVEEEQDGEDEIRSVTAGHEEEVPSAVVVVSTSEPAASSHGTGWDDEDDDDVPIEWVPIAELPQILKARRVRRSKDEPTTAPKPPSPETATEPPTAKGVGGGGGAEAYRRGGSAVARPPSHRPHAARSREHEGSSADPKAKRPVNPRSPTVARARLASSQGGEPEAANPNR